MPATESTWRSLKSMHAVFGVASVVMLITTIWMLAADHTRSWKNYQREFRDIESWSANAQVGEQDTADYSQTEGDLQQQLMDVQGSALSDTDGNCSLNSWRKPRRKPMRRMRRKRRRIRKRPI